MSGLATQNPVAPIFTSSHNNGNWPYDFFPYSVETVELVDAINGYNKKQGPNGVTHMGSQIIGYVSQVGHFTYSLDEKGNAANDETRQFFESIDRDLGAVTSQAARLKSFPWVYTPNKLSKDAEFVPDVHAFG